MAGKNCIGPPNSRLLDIYSTRVPQPSDATADNPGENRRRSLDISQPQ